MNLIFTIIHIIIAIALIAVVLLQSSTGGLGSAFGGGEAYRTKRGAERVVFIATIVLAVLFLTTSITVFIVR